jgi:hypothetical protein
MCCFFLSFFFLFLLRSFVHIHVLTQSCVSCVRGFVYPPVRFISCMCLRWRISFTCAWLGMLICLCLLDVVYRFVIFRGASLGGSVYHVVVIAWLWYAGSSSGLFLWHSFFLVLSFCFRGCGGAGLHDRFQTLTCSIITYGCGVGYVCAYMLPNIPEKIFLDVRAGWCEN